MDSRVAIVGGPHLSFLDHIIPLCDLLDMPLYAPDVWEWTMLYPHVQKAEELESYDTFFYVEPSRLHERCFQFGNHFFDQKRRSVCGLHGNSNKCRDAFWAERFLEEDSVLLYGPYMQQFFEEKGVYSRLKNPIFCGNYRLCYYEKYKEHFHMKLPGEGKKILYAPTWSFDGATDNSPFFTCYRRLLDHVPSGFTVLVKLHPYMYRLHPQEVQRLIEKYVDNPRVYFLEETPLVYPILDQIDIYIGDYSSVGYDFLSFDRPLFFWSENVDPHLLECGHKIQEGEIFSQLEKEGKSEKRQELYHHCFANVEDLGERLRHCCS
ncbi:MAG: CDP-glycerol glycerophosphotransferase family protein [Chlamydiales bacterium]|nr:CDP-glycerol glycerophosphotransferase family protein [Chlamydiales bacterium]